MQTKMQILNIWGTVNQYNYDQKCQQTKKYGHQRLLLGIYCTKMLQRFQYQWWLDGGNLLGAYRDGKMIAHDDDFDIGLLSTIQEFQQLYQKISETINSRFKVRYLNSYSTKIQIYDIHSGQYIIDNVHSYHMHNVSVNIQLYTYQPNHRIKLMFYRGNLYDYVPLLQDYILPLTNIQYCGHMFNSPNKIQTYLQTHYGYIGIGAIYNPNTRKYQDKKQISKMASKKADQGNHDELKNQ